jgi:hypothetical protein
MTSTALASLSALCTALLVAGCGSSKSRAGDPEAGAVASASRSELPERLVAGDYACGFSSSAAFLCRITEEGEFLTLEKLGGTERFSGSLSAGDVEGEVVWTNAAAEGYPATLTFKRQPDGSWFGEVPSDGEKLGYRLRYLGAAGSQFGGQAYAGAIER